MCLFHGILTKNRLFGRNEVIGRALKETNITVANLEIKGHLLSINKIICIAFPGVAFFEKGLIYCLGIKWTGAMKILVIV